MGLFLAAMPMGIYAMSAGIGLLGCIGAVIAILVGVLNVVQRVQSNQAAVVAAVAGVSPQIAPISIQDYAFLGVNLTIPLLYCAVST